MELSEWEWLKFEKDFFNIFFEETLFIREIEIAFHVLLIAIANPVFLSWNWSRKILEHLKIYFLTTLQHDDILSQVILLPNII